jgi:hypothetical protein
MPIIKDEILARIQAIHDKADFDVNQIRSKEAADVNALQTVVQQAQQWINQDTDQFQALVNKIVALVRQT